MAKKDPLTTATPEEEEQLPFSPQVLMLVKQIQQAPTQDERIDLMVHLANHFAADHDVTDESATDDYHEYVDEFIRIGLLYRQAAMKLGRLTVDLVQSWAAHNDTTVEQVADEAAEPTQVNPHLN